MLTQHVPVLARQMDVGPDLLITSLGQVISVVLASFAQHQVCIQLGLNYNKSNLAPCSSVTTVTDYCASIGCIAANNNPTGSWNTNANNANNACDFGISSCYSCPSGTSDQPTPPPQDY